MNDIEDDMRATLLRLARDYAKATGLALSTISQRIAGDSRFFENLSRPEPAAFSSRLYVRAVAQFRTQWPDGVALPKIDPEPITGKPRRSRPVASDRWPHL